MQNLLTLNAYLLDLHIPKTTNQSKLFKFFRNDALPKNRFEKEKRTTQNEATEHEEHCHARTALKIECSVEEFE